MRRSFPFFWLVWVALSCLFLAACGSATQIQVQPSFTPSAPTVAPSDTPPPSPTPPPGKVWVLGNLAADEQTWLAAQANQAGLALEQRDQLQPADLGAQTRVVILLSQPANLPDLQAAAPQAQFLVVASGPLDPAANLTVVQSAAENQAFAAGFLGVLLSPDWRAGGLIPSDAPQLQAAFVNGGGYFCGDCAPGWPLKMNYPQVSTTGSGASGADWAASANALFDSSKVEVFYLSASAYQPEVYAALAGKVQVERSVVVFGAQPPPDELKAQWAATVGVDLLSALQKAWPDLLAGKSAGTLQAGVRLSDVNSDLLSPGRQELFAQMLKELEFGAIRTGNVQ